MKRTMLCPGCFTVVQIMTPGQELGRVWTGRIKTHFPRFGGIMLKESSKTVCIAYTERRWDDTPNFISVEKMGVFSSEAQARIAIRADGDDPDLVSYAIREVQHVRKPRARRSRAR